jgi:ABC-type uncharacterized transport system auxiliary subunit
MIVHERKHSMRRGRPIALSGVCLLFFCLVLSGCAPTRRIQYYAINLPPVGAAVVNPSGATLVVGRIELAPALQDGRIRYRSGKTEVGGYENHRWSESPGIAVRDGLIRLLRASGKYQSVSHAGASAGGDYLVRGMLHEFSEIDDPAMHTLVSLSLEIYDRKRSRIVWQREFTREEPVSGHKVSDVTDSLDLGTQALLSEAVAGINSGLTDKDKTDKDK